MIFLLFTFMVLSFRSYSLTLEESISMYRERSKEHQIGKIQTEIYIQNFKEYERYNILNASIKESGTSYVNYRDTNHAHLEHRIRNVISPSLNIFGLNIYTKYTSDYVIENKSFDSRLTLFGFEIDLLDLFYYNRNAYLKESSYLMMEQQKLQNILDERKNISEIIDIYLAVKIYEGQLDIEKRALEQMNKDKIYITEKNNAGLASDIDLETVLIQISKLEQSIRSLARELYNNKLILCDRVGLAFDDQTFLDFDVMDVDITADNSDVKLLENQLLLSQKKNSYEFRKLFPALNLGLEYDWDESLNRYDAVYSLNLNWEFIGNHAEYYQSKRELEINKLKLEQLVNHRQTSLELKRNEFLGMLDDLAVGEEELVYWRKVIDVKREMYRSNLISLQDYMKFYNQYKDKEIEVSGKKYKINGFKRKLWLSKEIPIS